MCCFQVGPGATYYAIISEIFPLSYRAFGNAFGAGMAFLWMFVSSFLYPVTRSLFSLPTVFISGMVLCLLVGLKLYLLLPETRGLELEDSGSLWVRKKWNNTVRSVPSQVFGYDPPLVPRKSPTKILEWGGGYGNMCKVMNMVYGNLIESYTIIDVAVWWTFKNAD